MNGSQNNLCFKSAITNTGFLPHKITSTCCNDCKIGNSQQKDGLQIAMKFVNCSQSSAKLWQHPLSVIAINVKTEQFRPKIMYKSNLHYMT